MYKIQTKYDNTCLSHRAFGYYEDQLILLSLHSNLDIRILQEKLHYKDIQTRKDELKNQPELNHQDLRGMQNNGMVNYILYPHYP